MKVRINILILCLIDSINDSITNLNSGKNEIMRSRRASLKSRRTIIEFPAPVGIIDDITIIVSKTFQPSLKKSCFFDTEKNLISISMIKNIVTA